MMKKKKSILTLAILFFVSTTGLPLIVHYCNMMETASLQACEMHSQVKEPSCCETQSILEENFSGIYFLKAVDDCCNDFLVDYSIKENFLSSKTESFIPLYLYTIILIDNDLPLNYYSFFKVDTSPPPLIDNHLYLTNSILLI